MDYILGFAGIWFMADEAHLSNIAVRQCRQRRGIGELLVISTIKFAIEQNARFVTLEVRATNKVAQHLYRKCGFVEVGVRRGYYSDNKEDAVLMTAEAIASEGFLRGFEEVRAAYAERWGTPV
jgi:ribosomal-protein-alanine N-acetyltransferase